MDRAARRRGRRWWQHQRPRSRRSCDRGLRIRPSRGAWPIGARQRRGRGAVPFGKRRAEGRSARRASSRASSWPPGRPPSPGPTIDWATSRSRHTPRATASYSVARRRRWRRAVSPICLLVTARTADGTHQFPGSDRHTWSDDHSDARTRPHPALRVDCLRRRCAPGLGCGRRGRKRRLRRPPEPGDRNPGVRGDRGHGPLFRHHGGVVVQPLLVRSAPCLVPGAQAPLRRHEGLARGRSRDRRRHRCARG